MQDLPGPVIVTAVTGIDKQTEKTSFPTIIVPTDSKEGFTIKSEYDKMGVRGFQYISQLILDNVRVPKQNPIRRSPEKGFKQFLNTLGRRQNFNRSAGCRYCPRRILRRRSHTRANENNSADRSLISRRFSSSLPTWPWKLSSPAIWC